MSGAKFQWTQLNVTDGEERHLNGSRDGQPLLTRHKGAACVRGSMLDL